MKIVTYLATLGILLRKEYAPSGDSNTTVLNSCLYNLCRFENWRQNFQMYPVIFTFTTLWAISADDKLMTFFFFPRKQDLTFLSNDDMLNPISRENKKKFSKCRLLKTLPRVLSVK